MGTILLPKMLNIPSSEISFDPANGPQWMIIEALFDSQTLDELVADKIGTPLTEMVRKTAN